MYMKIVKGAIIPVKIGSEFKNHEIIENELDIFKKFINRVIKQIKKLLPKVETCEDLKKFNDAFVYFIEGCYSRIRRNVSEKMLSGLFQKDYAAFTDFFETNQKLAREFLKIPSDTRPGPNISSLWVHLRTTSALAASCYVHHTEEQGFVPENLEKLRFASLTHDFGKPFKRDKHVSAIDDAFDEFFKGYINDRFLADVRNGIKKHHSRKILEDLEDAPLYRHLIRADRSSSSQDRVLGLMRDVIPMIYGSKYDDVLKDKNIHKFDEWAKISDDIPEMTEKITRKIRENSIHKRFPPLTKDPEVALIIGDARRIKQYVDDSKKLKEIKGAAIILDESLTVGYKNRATYELNGIIPAIQVFKVQPESIVFFGGGNIILFGPFSRAKKIEKEIENAFRNANGEGINIITSSKSFSLDDQFTFGLFYKQLLMQLGTKKMELCEEPVEKIIEGHVKICSSCQRNAAIKENTEDDLCKACSYKRKKASDMNFPNSFANKWKQLNLKPPWIGSNNKDGASMFIQEFLAGWSQEDINQAIQGDKQKKMSLAIIKADGNLMGEFFGKTISITELVEKSILTDIAMEKCLEEVKVILDKSYDPNDEHLKEMKARIDLGEIYTGGDDLLLFLPSWISIPVSFIIMRKFYELMGGLVTLSMGVVSISPKSPQKFGIRIAEHLLLKAKEKSRDGQSDNIGYLDFEDIRGGFFTPELLDDIRQIAGKESRYYSRPFVINKNHDDDLTKILMELLSLDNFDLVECIKTLHEFQKKMLKPNSSEIPIKNYQRAIRKIVDVFEYQKHDKDVQKAITLGLYLRSKQDKNAVMKDIYTNLSTSLAKSHVGKRNCLILDQLDLSRILMGGN